MNESVKERVLKIIDDDLALDAPGGLTASLEESLTVGGLEMDDLDFQCVMASLELEFTISIDDAEFKKLKKVSDVVDLVEKELAKER